MRFFLIFGFLLGSSVSFAQSSNPVTTGRQYVSANNETSALMVDQLGQPIYPQQKYNWEGRVFFPDNYAIATITSVSGKVYRNIKTKINLLENKILFSDSADREFVVAIPVAKIEFDETVLNPKLVFIKPKGDTSAALYQVLDSGKIILLKKTFIVYKDQQGYASTTVTRVFEQRATYYSYVDATLTSIDKSKAAVLALMADKSNKIDAFIDQEKLKMRKEEDMIRVFHFYNSL